MSKKAPGVWGIDLGQCALKALRIEEMDGQVTATAFDYVEHPKILNQPDADPDQLMREALEKFLSRNQLRGDIVSISVPGQSGLARFVKLPPVEEKKIQDIVRFEAKQQIPFNLEEVVWDYQKIGAGIVTDGFAMDTEIGLFAMKRDKVAAYLQHFKEVKVEVQVVQMAPLALCNFLAYDLLGKKEGEAPAEGAEAPAPGGKRKCVVALDIGTDSSNLVITDGDRVIWQRPIPLGGNHFTRALTKDPFKLTFAKAEHLKRNATKSGPELKKILTALKPVLNDFVGEVQRSLGYFTNTHRDAQIQYLVGLGNAFRLPGLQRFLSEKLQIEVRKLGKLERLSGESVQASPVFSENVLSFAVAYGLALQGLNAARLTTNLLPPEIKVERLIRAKKPWAVAAAACLLLGIGGLAIGSSAQVREWNVDDGSQLGEAIKKADGVVKEKQKGDSDFKAAEDAAQKIENDVKSLAAGERVDWILLNQFITQCLPRPEVRPTGEVYAVAPLPDKARMEYWDQDALAKEAHQLVLDYQRKGKVLWPGKDADGRPKLEELKDFKDIVKKFYEREALKYATLHQKKVEELTADDRDVKFNLEAHLLQFSIEAVSTRYTDHLETWWAKVQERQKQKEADIASAIRMVDLTKDAGGPKDKGWVVELRGYTYHYANRQFVINTLLDDMALAAFRKEVEAPKKEGSAPGDAESKKSETPAENKNPVLGHVNYIVLAEISDPRLGAIPDPSLTAHSFLKTYFGEEASGSGTGGAPNTGGGGMKGDRGDPTSPGNQQAAAAPPTGRSLWEPLSNGPGESPGAGGGGAPGTGGPSVGMGPGGLGQSPKKLGNAGMGGGPPASGGMGGALGQLPRGLGGGTGGGGGLGGLDQPRSRSGQAPTGDTLVRTEFVIFFVWTEPTPSDALIFTDSGPKQP